MLRLSIRIRLFILAAFICCYVLQPVFGQDAGSDVDGDLGLGLDDSVEPDDGEAPGPADSVGGAPQGQPTFQSSPTLPHTSTVASGVPVASSTSTQVNIGGWPYPGPAARDPTDDIPDGIFPFVRININDLANNKRHKDDADQGLQNALWYLQTKARRYVANTTVFSVVNKKIVAPSNDSHDYMSLARYYWPDQTQPNGLPYIRIDGHVNPEIGSVPDYQAFREMLKHVQFLSLAYYYFDNETYAERAIQHVRAWFLDPETRMNPHLQYASIIRGYDMGRAKGIIDFSVVPDLLDSIAILQHSKSWPPRMSAGLRLWFVLYVEWLKNSPNGWWEKTAQNNHGTFYDVQLLAISYFLGQDRVALEVAQNATASRIGQQLLSSGEQYFETDRPFSWFYSIFNLRGLFQLAELAERVEVNLWNFQTVDGKSIKRALDYLIPSAVNNSLWKFPNSQGFGASSHLVEVLQKAYIVYGSPEYLKLGRLVANQQSQLYNVTRLTLPWDHLSDKAVTHILAGTSSSTALLTTPNFIAVSLASLAMMIPLLW